MYAYAMNNPLKFVDPNGEDIEVLVHFEGAFTEEEKQKIIEALKRYLSRLDVGKVVVRTDTEKDTRTVSQWVMDATWDSLVTALGAPVNSFAEITANLNRAGVSPPTEFRAAGSELAKLRKADREAFVAKVAEGILHEVLAHQLAVGRGDDNILFRVWEGTRQQATDPYFRTRQGTLMDSNLWRGGTQGIRPLYPADQEKIQERLKPIHRKYKD